MGRLRVLGTAVLLLSVPAHAAAQSLADLAKRAEDQRKAAGGQGTRIEIVEEPSLRPVPLSKVEVEHYVNLRMAMAHLWHRDHALFERVRGGTLTARTLPELCRVLESEPQLVKLLALYDYSPEAFFATTRSIAQAERLTQGGFDMASLSPVERENYAFAGRHMAWLSIMRGKIHKAEAGLTIWR